MHLKSVLHQKSAGCTKSRGVSRCRNEASGYGALYQRINVLYLFVNTFWRHDSFTNVIRACKAAKARWDKKRREEEPSPAKHLVCRML